jgi:hypothetical protein
VSVSACGGLIHVGAYIRGGAYIRRFTVCTNNAPYLFRFCQFGKARQIFCRLMFCEQSQKHKDE